MAVRKKRTDGILATFEYLDDLCDVMDKMKLRDDFTGHEVYSPTSYHEIVERAEERYGPSQVRWFTLVGALTGVTSGFGMCLATDYNWPIVVGGKMAGLYSLPAYVIFGFELMILLGAIATIFGMLIMGRLPDPYAKIFHPRITDDLFAVFVPGVDLGGAQAQLLKECGALEVTETN